MLVFLSKQQFDLLAAAIAAASFQSTVLRRSDRQPEADALHGLRLNAFPCR
jgi:hypothetical protein